MTKSTGTISYTYDANGNRISKTANGKETWYVRDASGNVMSVYEQTGSGATAQIETDLYGSSRLGLQTGKSIADVSKWNGTATLSTFTRGEKIFELSNHLGNVLVTVNDRKVQHTTDNSTVDYWEAEVVSANDYYPFGMGMPGRGYNAGSYRYGFNGKENDGEIYGEGNTYNFGARIQDPRLGGRFFSLDPYTSKYPLESPYSFAGNSPIIAIDKDGKFPVWTHYQMIFENLLEAKVDKKTAHEIALFGSTYTDHPTDWKVMPYNKILSANYGYNPSRLDYDNPDYEETSESQSDELISSVSIHGMRTWWEDISPNQAVDRALYGGTFKELNGTVIKIKGAYQIINELKGKDISKLSRKDKKMLGQALHTIEDCKIHNGKRWVDKHKYKAAQIKIYHKDANGEPHIDVHKNEHPDSHEVPVNNKEHADANAATKDAIKTIQTP
ncbi:MAG: hypothetical protein H7329_02785 [Opitutaceae bacterium]|nr:hypothetical protein [Cytophagales bacterium]